jgi:hypothetical protein
MRSNVKWYLFSVKNCILYRVKPQKKRVRMTLVEESGKQYTFQDEPQAE